MAKRLGNRARDRSHQQGAVAIMVAVSLVLLIGMLGFVIDLGHLYVAKTELQNAADAAALSGAKQLDGTVAGIDSAVTWAKTTSKENEYDFSSTDVVIQDADIQFSCTANGPWLSIQDAKTGTEPSCLPGPDDKYFIKVENVTGSIPTWFIQVLQVIPGLTAIENMSTRAMAVAGRYITPITPLGVCAIDSTAGEKWVSYGSGADDKYKVAYGFVPGVSYDFGTINDAIGGLTSGAPLYLHPTAKTLEECQPNQNNANFPVSYMCVGKSSLSGAGYAYVNTGWGGPDIYTALNSRFTFDSKLTSYGLDSNICKPDANIKEFTPSVAEYRPGNPNGWVQATESPIDQTSIYRLSQWLVSRTGTVNPIKNANEKSNDPVNGGCKAAGGGPSANGDCSDNYGVLWSYARPNRPSGTAIPITAWNPPGNSSPALYPEGPVAHNYPTTGYDPSGLNLPASPYAKGMANKESDPYYQAGTNGVVGRRVLNVAILDCADVNKNPGCDSVKVLGIGSFFMQSKADFATKKIPAEFIGLTPDDYLAQDIRLYH